MGNPESAMKKMTTRSVLGFAMMSSFSGIVWSGHMYIGVFVVMMQGVIFRELLSVRYAKYQEQFIGAIPLFRTVQWGWFLVAQFYVHGGFVREFCMEHQKMFWLSELTRYHQWVSFVFYAGVTVLTVACMRAGYVRYQVGQLTWTVSTLLVVLGQMHWIGHNITNGIFWFFLPCALVITNDIMAYFSGVLLGRRITSRKFLSISPNKTWEGFVGAFLFTVLFGFAFSGFLGQYQWFICPVQELSFALHPNVSCAPSPVFTSTTTLSFPPAFMAARWASLGLPAWLSEFEWTVRSIQVHGAVLATVASLVAPFGGFMASAVKRAYRVKDFDSIIPGHGGVTDRMDCQFLMALFTWCHYSAFVVPGGVSVTRLLASASLLAPDQQLELYRSLGETLAQAGLLS